MPSAFVQDNEYVLDDDDESEKEEEECIGPWAYFWGFSMSRQLLQELIVLKCDKTR